MTSEISASTINVTGNIKRTIPILHRYSSVSINIPSGAGTRITTDSVLASQSIDNTGFVYESPGILRNVSGNTLVCLISYAIAFNSVSSAFRMSWIQLDAGNERFAMECQGSTTDTPTMSNCCILRVPHNSYITLWCYQNTGFSLTAIAQFGMPYINICII